MKNLLNIHTENKTLISHDIITKARRAQEAIQIEKKKKPKALSENRMDDILQPNQKPNFSLNQNNYPNIKYSKEKDTNGLNVFPNM